MGWGEVARRGATGRREAGGDGELRRRGRGEAGGDGAAQGGSWVGRAKGGILGVHSPPPPWEATAAPDCAAMAQ